jgi:dihydroxyacetone kinase
MAAASSLGNRESYDREDMVKAAVAARDAVVALGNAEPGDKTVVDALYPFVETLRTRISLGSSVIQALRTAAEAATRAAAETAPLRPRKGRARPLADRSVGTPDPGAVSFALIATALAKKVSLFADSYEGTGSAARSQS